MRLNDHQVVQLIESSPAKLVVRDDDTGVEALIRRPDLSRIKLAIDEAETEGCNVLIVDPTITDISGGEVSVPNDSILFLRRAIDYFERYL